MNMLNGKRDQATILPFHKDMLLYFWNEFKWFKYQNRKVFFIATIFYLAAPNSEQLAMRVEK